MHERLTHRYSKPYMAGLLALVTSLSAANYQQFEPLMPTPRDTTFLLSIQQILSELSHDASVCTKTDCKFVCGHKLSLPNLSILAETAKTSIDPPIFYTNATFVEYHRLLVNLLEHFKLHLSALKKVTRRGIDYCHCVDKVRFFGSALHNMAFSQTMERHMQNIQDSLVQEMRKYEQEKADQKAKAATKGDWKGNLSDKLGFKKKKSAAEAGDGGEGASAGVDEEEVDESIASIRTEAIEYLASNREQVRDSTPRCSQWLRLMTTYFDAMDQLLPSGSTSPQLPINSKVQVIAVGHQGKERLDWELCLAYLPHSKTHPNGEELISDFKKLLQRSGFLNSWFNRDTGTFRNDNFEGTLHCEAIASALMHLQRQGSMTCLPVCFFCILNCGSLKIFHKQELENLLGISKRCCPVCTFLIQHLGGFVMRGAHKSFSLCSLPPWLSDDDIRAILDEFSRRLRKILDNLLYEEPLTERQERASISSTCLSVMSKLDRKENSWGADLYSKEVE